MNSGDLDRLLREPAPDEPLSPRPFTPPRDGVIGMTAVRPARRSGTGTRGWRPSAVGVVVMLVVVLGAGFAVLSVALPRASSPAAPSATPTLPPGVTVTREAAIVVAIANGGGAAPIDVRVGRIGDFDPNQQIVPADRLVWAITYSGGNSSTMFVDAATGAWLEGMSPASAVIIGSLSTAGLAQASSLPGPASVLVGGLIVVVPAGWRFYAMDQISSFSDVSGVLANFDLGAACRLPDISGGCLGNVVLGPGEALVFIGGAGFPGWTVEGLKPAGGWSAFIGGLPAALSVTTSNGPYGAAQERYWAIAGRTRRTIGTRSTRTWEPTRAGWRTRPMRSRRASPLPRRSCPCRPARRAPRRPRRPS